MKARIKKVTTETFDLDGKVVNVEVGYYPQVKRLIFGWCSLYGFSFSSFETAKKELLQHLGNKKTKVEYINFK